MGLGLLRLMGYEEAQLESILLSLRPGASPHKRLAGYFDQELNSDISSVANSLHQNRIDKMKRELEELMK